MALRNSSSPRGRLATQLEEWAFVREKVLEKLDIRGARAARELAGRIREVILRMAEEAANQRVPLLVELRDLCTEANILLAESKNQTVPEVPIGQRPTLPVPRPVARLAFMTSKKLASGIHTTASYPDRVKNHALRRQKSGER